MCVTRAGALVLSQYALVDSSLSPAGLPEGNMPSEELSSSGLQVG